MDTYLRKEKDEATTKESQRRLENAISENRSLKKGLQDTQTNITLLQTDFNQMRSQYDEKCYELHE
jgi:hypothetical protein